MLNFLSTELREKAFVWNDEGAWSKLDAIDVIHYLARAGACMIGVEVWLPTPNGPRIPYPWIYQWSTDFENTPLAEDIVKANLDAENYIANFSWDDHDVANTSKNPYFNLSWLEPSEIEPVVLKP